MKSLIAVVVVVALIWIGPELWSSMQQAFYFATGYMLAASSTLTDKIGSESALKIGLTVLFLGGILTVTIATKLMALMIKKHQTGEKNSRVRLSLLSIAAVICFGLNYAGGFIYMSSQGTYENLYSENIISGPIIGPLMFATIIIVTVGVIPALAVGVKYWSEGLSKR